jgi:hypothetical protein
MTATSVSIATPEKGDSPLARTLPPLPVAASTRILAGTLVALNASGYLVHASADPSLRVLGRAEEEVDNSAGAAGQKTCRVKRGVFGWTNSAASLAISNSHVGRPCYAVDNQTVALRNPTGEYPYAGRVYDVDDDGLVYVETGATPPDDPSSDDLFLLAGADLSANGQNRFVALNSAGAVVLASTAGMPAVGVLLNAPTSGAVAIVRRRGRARVLCEEAASAGTLVAVAGTTGRAKAAVVASANTSTGAITASFVLGTLLEESTGAGDLAVIDVHPCGCRPGTFA